MKSSLLAVWLLVAGCGGAGELATAHTSITAGCIAASNYSVTHDEVTVADVDEFEGVCRKQLVELERWHSIAPDGGTE